MKATKYIKPYILNGKGELKKQVVSNPKINTGVYLIKENKKIVYVGYSKTHLDKTAYHHFQSWSDQDQTRAIYDRKKVTVKFIFCSPAKAKLLEVYFIEKLKPRDNERGIIHRTNKFFKLKAKQLIETITESEPF